MAIAPFQSNSDCILNRVRIFPVPQILELVGVKNFNLRPNLIDHVDFHSTVSYCGFETRVHYIVGWKGRQAEEAFQKRLLHASCYTCPQRLLLPKLFFFLLLLRPLTYFFGWKSRRNSLMMITYSRITPLSSFYALVSVCATASTSYHHILPSMQYSPSTTILYGLTIHQYIKKRLSTSPLFYILLDIIAMK